MSKLSDWQAAIEEYDRVGYTHIIIENMFGDAKRRAAVPAIPDFEAIARQALKIALAAEAVNNASALDECDRDGDLICSGCGAYKDGETIHDENCPVKRLRDALKEIQS